VKRPPCWLASHRTEAVVRTVAASRFPQDLFEVEAALKLPWSASIYRRVAMVEFKREPEGGRWVLLEVNARFWGSSTWHLHAGADFPLAVFQLFVEGRTRVAND
jgi:hypothetical protein